jgi:hypothetical protein
VEIPWTFGGCILCHSNDDLTDEHIIPEALGGRLFVKFLCKPCNSRLGHSVEPLATQDPSIRLAIENLAEKIPDLAAAMREGKRYVVRSAGGLAQAYWKRGRLEIRSARAEDGSILQPTAEGRSHIETVLRKSGAGPDEIQRKLAEFDKAPENVAIKLHDSMTAIKWRVDEIHPALDAEALDDRVLLKIAFEWFAAHAAEAMYLDVPQMEEIRQVLQNAKPSSDSYSVERFRTRKYRAMHGLALEHAAPYAVITINLFGYLLYRVHLHTVSMRLC